MGRRYRTCRIETGPQSWRPPDVSTNEEAKMFARMIPLLPLALPLVALPQAGLAADTQRLEEAKLIIEHNATDHDTGFQGQIDGEGWQSLTLRGPSGDVARSAALGSRKNQGLT